MKKLFLVFFACVLLCSNAFSQQQWPPVYEIKTDTIAEQMLDSVYWQKLEDKEGKWTIDDVRKEPLSGQFHIQKGDTAGFKTHWQRYRVRNSMQQQVKIFLTSASDFYDVFIVKNNGAITHYRSGALRKWSDRDGLKGAEYLKGALPVIIMPGEEITIYDRRSGFNKGNIIKVTVRLLNTEKVMSQYIDYGDSRSAIFQENNLYEIFTVGLLFFSFLLSLFFYRSAKEKVYLWFALYAIFLAVIHLHNIADLIIIWFKPEWSYYVQLLSYPWTFIPFFLIQFLRHFFVVKNKYPKWDRFFYWAGIVSILSGAGQAIIGLLELSFPYFGELNFFMIFLIIPITVIITALLYIRSKSTPFRYIVYGVLPLMFVYLVFFCIFSYSKKDGELFNWGLKYQWLLQLAGLCWLVLWFVRVLIMRYDTLRKENVQQAIDKERERNELIAAQKIQLEKDVALRTAELKQSLEKLKSTQSQLIQAEKMASLGELTAGIAHEIQNPLNFVNNFSEVSGELTKELVEEVDKGNTEEVKVIAADLVQNLEKINHHGKRADAIVKGMLQHSRSSSGKKEPTDINALCDEYLRLAYHGLRAKDKSFNATLKTNFDDTVGKISIIPQDIGRVILNLITNAFYVVDEKRKTGITDYIPEVEVSTKKTENKVFISVKDNGNGIPDAIKEKIFQPFFTTKPTGQGTGLGLSLSYDIVKAHGGELKLNTQEGKGAAFDIILPVY